jgi:hypothetical protein
MIAKVHLVPARLALDLQMRAASHIGNAVEFSLGRMA